MPPRNYLKGSYCGGRRTGGKANPRLANLKWDLMTGPPWGFLHGKHLPQFSHSWAGSPPGLPHHSPCRSRPSVFCLVRAERYLTSPYSLWSYHTVLITGPVVEPHHSLIRLVVVRLTAGCVLWVAGNGWSLLCNFGVGSFTAETNTHTYTHIDALNKLSKPFPTLCPLAETMIEKL